MIDLSIIIVSYKSTDEILANIESIKRRVTTVSYEILIVNNCAEDLQLPAALEAYDNLVVIDPKSNLGFGRANNLGLEQAQGKFILFVNPDVIFLSDIRELLRTLESDPKIGLIGPITYDAKGRILPSCGEYPSVRNFFSYNFFLNNLFPKVKWWGSFSMKYFDFKSTREVDWISGAFMLGRKSVIDTIGGFDKDFFMYGEDIDICWRLRKADCRIIFSDKASIIHNAGHSTRNKTAAKAKMIVESSRILWSKHYEPGTVKKLFIVFWLGSAIRKVFWKLLNLTGISKNKNMGLYYGTIAAESRNWLKGVKQR